MKLNILNVPDEALRKKSNPVADFNRELHEFLLDLEETLKKASDPEGVGLSAPQVDRNIRAFATYLDKKIRFFVNPELIDQSDDLTLGPNPKKPMLEGCLSIPQLYGPVWRPKKIKIKALDEHGNEFTKTYTSFKARVFLHELDHLDGILFTDYTKKDDLPLYLLENDKFTQIDDPDSLLIW